MSTADPIREREALILGAAPRIPPLKAEELSAEVRTIVRTMRKALSLPLDGEIAEYHLTMLRHPELYRRHSELAIQLFRGTLTPRQRELAILRTAWLNTSPYEWGEHIAIGRNLAGLGSEETERVTIGSAAPGWNDEDRAILRAVEELHAEAFISDQAWHELACFLSEEQLLELPILIGQYQGLAYFLNSMRARLKPSNPGLSAR
jgi:4-carboxymuconolactone decarboxylase